MKKLCLILLGLILASNVWADKPYSFRQKGISYHITNDKEVSVWVSNYTYTYKENKKVTELTIPETVKYKGKTYRVTEINWAAFWNYVKLKTVHLPNSIKHIDNCAFFKCYELENINFPDSLERIGVRAFAYSKLRHVELPSSLTTFSFDDCKHLESVKLPENLKHLERWAFGGCTSLKEITLPETLEEIDEKAFVDCKSLKDIYLPENLKAIGDSVFAGCILLDSIHISNSVKEMGKDVFRGCKGLKTVVYNSTALTNQLQGLDSLETVIIGDSVQEISNDAFLNCHRLANIDIPNSVTTIGERAFQNTAIKSMVAGNNITHIGSNALSFGAHPYFILAVNDQRPETWASDFTSNEEKVIYGTRFLGDNGFVYGENQEISGTLDVVGYLGTDTKITIPEMVEADGAVRSVVGIRSMTCPNIDTTLTYSIQLPNSIIQIGGKAFYNIKLSELTIPYSVREIGYKAFNGGKINCEINRRPHCWSGLWTSNDKSVTWGTKEFPDMEYAAFNGNEAMITNYNGIASEVILPDSVLIDDKYYALSAIGDKAFQSTYVQQVTLPAGIRYIGQEAFADCRILQEIQLPDSLEHIEVKAFYRSGLQTITIPSHVSHIGDMAFSSCYKLENAFLTDSTDYIGYYAFGDNEKLTINLDGDIDSINNWANEWASNTPIKFNYADESVKKLRVIREKKDGKLKFGMASGYTDIEWLKPEYDLLFIMKDSCVIAALNSFEYLDKGVVLPDYAIFIYDYYGKQKTVIYDDLLAKAVPGEPSMDNVIFFAKKYYIRELEAQAEYRMSMYYAGQGELVIGLQKAKRAFYLDPELTAANDLATKIQNDIEEIRIREEKARQLAYEQEQERKRQEEEARQRQLAYEQEQARKQARWDAVATALNGLSQTLGAIQQIQNSKNQSRGTQTRTTTANRSYSSSSSSSSYSSSSSSRKTEKMCSHCHGSKRCEFDEYKGYSKYVKSSCGLLSAVCSTCYGTGICQFCATTKASSSSLCPICKGDRGCQECHGKGKYKGKKCPTCNGNGECTKCSGSGLR